MKIFPSRSEYIAELLEQCETKFAQEESSGRRTFLKEALALLTLSGAVSCSSAGGGVKSAPMISFTPSSVPLVKRSPKQLYKEVNVVTSLMLPSNNRLRMMRSHPMRPRFITVHNTENPGAGAIQHGRALLNCALRNDWHYTVDQSMAVQHIPLTETGFHADSGGPGDRFSIGIEMCEKRGESLPRTFDRAAKLIAYQMKEWDIPLRNVVPHFYWTGKRCPHLLLDNGVPKAKWSWFISRVDYYHRCIS